MRPTLFALLPLALVALLPPATADPQTQYRKRAAVLRTKYRALYRASPRALPDGGRAFGDGRAYRRHGIEVLFLRGTSFEMAYQHGRLLREQIRQGAIRQATRMVQTQIDNALGKRPWLSKLATSAVHRLVTDRMLAHALGQLAREDALDQAVAMSDATGFDLDTLVRALFGPETLLILANGLSRTGGARVKLRAPQLNCSSFAAWGPATADGEMIIGRNMDFPLNGYYDRFPTIAYYEPTDGGQKFMTFVSAGVQNAGLTAYNESGLFISVHTVPTAEVSARGVPAFLLASQVIRQARTFDEAVRLFKRFRPPTGWAYLLASTRERKVASVELSNEHFGLRLARGNTHVQTNHYRTPAMAGRNLFINQSAVDDIEGRFLRISQRLVGARGRLDPAGAMSILADQHDPLTGTMRGLGATVGVHLTLTSVVLQPARNRVFMANGMAPVCHNTYVAFPLIGRFAREDFPTLRLATVNNHAYRRSHPGQYYALKLFIEAKRAYEDNNDAGRALALMQHVTKLDGSNPAYFFELAILALLENRRSLALGALARVHDRPYRTAQLERLARYYRGRVLADQGQRAEALRLLDGVARDASADRKLRCAASKAALATRVLGRYPLRSSSLRLMMQQADLLGY